MKVFFSFTKISTLFWVGLVCLTSCAQCADPDPRPDTSDISNNKPDADISDSGDTLEMGTGEVTFAEIGVVYVGAYVDVFVDLSAGLGIPFEDITFSIEGQFNQGGSVSRSQPAGVLGYDAVPKKTQVTILAGGTPGTYNLVAKKSDGSVLGRKQFQLTARWEPTDVGPPIWLQGSDINRFESDSWGVAGKANAATALVSGSNGLGLAEHPGYNKQIGKRRVLVIMVDFEDAKFTNEQIANTKKHWEEALLTGENNPDFLRRSVRQYYKEVSNGALEIEGAIFGPVHMPNTPMRDIFADRWQTNTQQIVTAALQIDKNGDGTPDIFSPDYDLRTVDSIVFVTPVWKLDPVPDCVPTLDPTEICDGIDNDCDGKTDAQDSEVSSCTNPQCGNGVVDVDVSDANGDSFDEQCDDGNTVNWDYCNNECKNKTQHYPWPAASSAAYALPLSLGLAINRRYAIIKMPANWDEIDGRQIVETLTHELGHNLGLPDLYSGSSGHVRTMGKWDVMANEGALGYINLSDRIALGWVPSEKIHTFNSATEAIDYAELYNLDTYAYSLPSWQVGTEEMGIEVRITEGWNYYIEYRYGATNHVGDWERPFHNARDRAEGKAGHVLITERREGGGDLTAPQRIVSYAPEGADGVPARFDSSKTRYVLNNIGGGATDLVVEALSLTRKAVIKVEHMSRATDPSIRKWPSPDHRYQSPDIKVVNEKNKANAAWENVPWAEHENDIVATVHNSGNEDATRVKVKFSYFDFTVTRDQSPIFLGEEIVDIDANGEETVTFSGWVPPSGGHYCVQVQIEPYKDPTSGQAELSLTNNIAQSNYTKYWSPTASPSRRIVHDVTVHNPHKIAAVAHLRLRNRSDDFRAYLSARWVRIEAGKSTKVQVAHEYVHDDFEGLSAEHEDYSPKNTVDISAWMAAPDLPYDSEQTAELVAGATMDIQSGIATTIDAYEVNINLDSGEVDFKGQVLKAGQSRPVPNAEVWLSIWDTSNKLVDVKRLVADSESRFSIEVEIPGGVGKVEVEYPGQAPYAPSRWRFGGD